MLTPEAAWLAIEPYAGPLAAKGVPRWEAAGRHLAKAFHATTDLPAHDVSAMDGYALTGTVQPGERLPVAGTIAAGEPPGATLAPGHALRIMTGAPLPSGADRVLPIEATDGGVREVFVRESVEAGAHVRRRGEIHRAGQMLLPAGTLLTPGALALLAVHGHANLPVHRAPRVAVMTTGDEVVPPEREPGPGKLRDSHTDFLLAGGRSLGLPFTPLGICPDDPRELRRRIAPALSGFDVLLLGGGVSKGDFDFVEGALTDLGCEVVFDLVAMQPGKPLVFARHSAGLVFGLPGNPASVMVSFWLFVRPLLRRLLGAPDGFWHGALVARLAAPLPGAKERDRFLPCEIAFRDGLLLASPVPILGSHDLAGYARGTALVRVRPGARPADIGAPCEVLPFADWRGAGG